MVRAATCRSSSTTCRSGKTEVICGQGPAPAGATIAHYRSSASTWCPAPGCSPPACPARSIPGCCCCATTARMRLADVLAPAIDYAQNGHPLVERANATIATVEELFRDTGRLRRRSICPAARCRRPARCSPTRRWPTTYTRVLREAESAGGDRVAQIERARKVWSQGFVAEAIDRFCRTQAVMDTSGERAPRRAHRRRHGALARPYRGAADLRLRPLHRVQARAVGAGAGDAAAACAVERVRSRRPRPGRRGFRPSPGGVLQARLCRPREILRRSRFRRGADGDAVVGRLQRRAAQAGRRQGLARIAPGLGRRISARW